MKTRRDTGSIFSFLALLILAVGAPLGAVPPQHANNASIERLKRSVDAVLVDAKIPGAGIALVARDREIWVGGVGKADLAADRDIDTNTVFRIGSMTKSVVALALLKLAEQGRIDLEARLRDVAPELKVENPWDQAHPVRISHILEHTAGFDDVHFNEMFCESSEPTLLEVLAINPRSWRVRWPPGTRMSYSNPGYAIAGYLIERSSGQPFEEFLRQSVLEPLGMRSTNFRLPPERRPSLAQGYGGNPPRPVPYRTLCLRSSGGLIASARDMGVFVRFLLNRGMVNGIRVLRPESIVRMETSRTLPYEGLEDAYGLGNYSSVDLEFITHGHGGRTEGFHSRYRYSTDLGLGYVVLFNTDYKEASLEKIERLILGYLTTGLLPPPPPRRVLPSGALSELTGYYEFASPRRQSLAFWDKLTKGEWVTLENGFLSHHRLLQERKIWIPTGVRTFRSSGESGTSILFATGPEGKPVLIAGRHYYEKVPGPRGVIRTILFFGGLLTMLTAPASALFWLLRWLWKRPSRDICPAVEVLPLLAVLSLAGVILSLSKTLSVHELGRITAYTVGIFGLTWAFAVLSAAGLIRAIGAFSLQSRRGITLHALLVSLANCGFAAYLVRLHLIGLRVWEL